MISKPKLEQRGDQHYVGIRTQVPSSKFKKIIPQFLDELFAWLGKQGVQPVGAPFMRYHVINMAGNMDVELGVPVDSALAGDQRVRPGVIPAGRYAALVYSGVTGIAGNKALIEWANKNGIKWDRWDDPNGDAFRSRIEYFLTDPAEQPDRNKWETEVAIRVADG
ncbi:MAG TPA: GyrI-like domain-containing protein [Roseiflexaceae bacterium]|nr:GyrI-like domain-containing protein [Roseiflexaceae bacterium]